MQLSPAIHAYFDADRHQDPSALASAFSGDAVVRDEGAEHVGPVAIREWWTAAKARYHQSARPLDATQAGVQTVVRALVTGEFPGSPATLTFRFTLADDRIARLEIG